MSEILVRAPNWVGDAVMSLPFFASLKKNAPDSRITGLCHDHLVPILSQVDGVDRVIALDGSAGRRGWRTVMRNAALLGRERFDIGFCLPPSFGSAFMLWRARIRRRIGYAADRRGMFLTDSIPYRNAGDRLHRTDGYLALLDLVWPDAVKEKILHYEPGEEANAEAEMIWSHRGLAGRAPVLALAPCSAQPARIWFADRYVAVARRWVETTTGAVVLIGAQSEWDACEAIGRSIESDRVINLAGAGDIGVAGALLRHSDAFVGNDSGLAHLAAAVGTPTVVISGPGDPREIGPYSDQAVSVKKSLFCAPCHKGTCWRRDNPLECLDLVSVEDVWAHLATHCGRAQP